MDNTQVNVKSQEAVANELDSTKTKKFVKFSEKKEASLKLCEFASRTITLAALGYDIEGIEGCVVPKSPYMTYATLKRIRDCSSWVIFATPENFEKLKKFKGYVCEHAFCPICAAYRSRRDGLKYSVMMDAAQDLKYTDVLECYGEDVAYVPSIIKAMEKGVEYVLFELTTPNVKGDKLKEEYKRYSKAFHNLRRWLEREFPEYLGFIRKLEVTYNKQKVITQDMWDGTGKYNSPWKYKLRRMGLKVGDRNPYYDTYHPHYHVIMAVTPDFFYTDDEGNECKKITRELLLEKWRHYMGDPSITQVHIQKVYKVLCEGNSATAEIGKYVAKDSDYLHSPKVFKVFYESLKGVQRVTYGGIFKVMHKLFEERKLDMYCPIDETVYKWLIDYRWAKKSYKEKVRWELTAEESDIIAGLMYYEANDTDDF